jgi:hypothetical protein
VEGYIRLIGKGVASTPAAVPLSDDRVALNTEGFFSSHLHSFFSRHFITVAEYKYVLYMTLLAGMKKREMKRVGK